MSTKIYNGYVMHSTTLVEARNKLVAFREKYNERAKGLILNYCWEEGDIEKTWKNLQFLSDGLRQVEKTKLRNPLVDYTASMCIREHGENVYLLLYIEDKQLKHQTEESLGLEFFGYWDNTDPQDGVSDEDWEKRGKLWDELMGEDSVPSHQFLTYDLCSYMDAQMLFHDVADMMRERIADSKEQRG